MTVGADSEYSKLILVGAVTKIGWPGGVRKLGGGGNLSAAAAAAVLFKTAAAAAAAVEEVEVEIEAEREEITGEEEGL